MGKVSEALRQTLESYRISQNELATTLGVGRHVVFRWFHNQVDPMAETVADIVKALKAINPDAAREFVSLYLGEYLERDRVESEVANMEFDNLPESSKLDIPTLSGLFSRRSSSYKFLFFISLLDILKRRKNFEATSPINFQEIFIEMLANAWYPHTYFKLSFGIQDRIAEKLDSLNLQVSEPILKFTDPDKKLLRKTIEANNLQDIIAYLKRYVPFLLIIPFLRKEIKEEFGEIDNDEEHKFVPDVASAYFESKKPIYKFDTDSYKTCTSIILHPDWVEYIEEYQTILRGWVSWEWLKYMQKRNPSTPAIVNKLFPPVKRSSLTKQTAYWNSVIKNTESVVQCIYSGQELGKKFSLDHYVPWSFVVHDQLWNLVPVIPEINSSKSNNLPPNQFFGKFVELQHLGLTVSHESMTRKKWEEYVESHVTDLGFSNSDDLLDIEKLRNAYDGILQPLLSLAAKTGFKEWQAM